MADFQALGATVKRMAADGVSPEAINKWLGQAGVDLDTLNASGFGLSNQKKSSKLRSAGIGLTQGLTANFGDEVASGIAATIGRPGGEALPGETWGERYQSGLNIARPQQKEAQETNPWSYGAGQFAGAVVPAVLAPEAFGSSYIANAPTMLNMMGRSALVGGGYGGVSAFGGAEGTPAEQFMQAAEGAGAGAIIGAATPPAILGMQKLGSWGWNGIKGAFTPAETITEAATGAAAPAARGAPGAAVPITPAAPTAPVIDAVESVRPRATIDIGLQDKAMAINKIAEALRRDGYSVADIQKMLNAAGPDATLADFGRNTQQLLTSSMGAPGPGKQIGATILDNRQLSEQGRLLKSTTRALGGGAGFHETDTALLDRLEKEAVPLYQKAYAEAQPVDISGILDEIDIGLAKVPQKSPIRAAVERVKSMLLEEVKDIKGKSTNRPYADLETLHNSKLAIDDMLSKYSGDESLGNVSRRQVMQIKTALLEAMDASNPAYGEARSKFSGIMTSKDALAAGRAFIKSDAEITMAELAKLAPEDQQFFREGAKRALADIIKSKPSDVSVVQLLRKTGLLDKVKAITPSEEAFNSFVQDLSNARRFAITRAAATGGSQTVEKALGAADLAGGVAQVGQAANGNASGLIMSIINKGRQMLGPGEETRAKIAQSLLQTPGPKLDELLKELADAQRMLEALRLGTGTVAIGGASVAGPALGRRR